MKKSLKTLKVCIACSAGGHLMEALAFLPAFHGHKRFFVTFEREQVKDILRGEKVYFVIDPKRNPKKLLKNFSQAIKILKNERPDVVLSTGAAAAVPLCYAAKILGIKIIFIESLAAVNKPTLSGRAVYPIADMFVVQSKHLMKNYRDAVYGGSLI
jgi:UDP-N-acetylglucosamine:LPS N-acetylglucosamine transferase